MYSFRKSDVSDQNLFMLDYSLLTFAMMCFKEQKINFVNCDLCLENWTI